MNILLWILQGLAALLFGASGVMVSQDAAHMRAGRRVWPAVAHG